MKSNLLPKSQSRGFTIIELMIATTIFSLILLLCMAGIMQITRLYYRGVTQASTQEAARIVADEFSQAIQFSNSAIYFPTGDDANPTGPDIDPVSGDPTIGLICIGGKRYTYHVDRQLINGSPDSDNRQVAAALIVDTPKDGAGNQLGCAGAVSISPLNIDDPDAIRASGGVELLEENMRLLRLDIASASAESDAIWTIDIAVAYGDQDLLEYDPVANKKRCKPSGPGIEFCAVSEISTTVRRRVE